MPWIQLKYLDWGKWREKPSSLSLAWLFILGCPVHFCALVLGSSFPVLSPQQGRSPRYVTPVFGCQETKQLCHLPAPLCFSAWNVQSLVGQTTNYFSTKVFDGSNAPCKPGLPRSVVSNICPPSVRESLSNIYLFKVLKAYKSLQQGKFSYWFHYAHSPLTATLEDAELKQWLRTDCKYCWEWEGFCCLVSEA